MKTINIHGKEYVEVKERIKYFREAYDHWSLITEFIELSENKCVMMAKVLNEEGRVIADGIAEETKGSSTVNRTSFIENCQTSAWGRALGNLGIGLDNSVASADEVKFAISQEKPKKQEPVKIKKSQFESMKAAIENGDSETVKSRMNKYIFTEKQEDELKSLLSSSSLNENKK
tara:strand:- start:472 stop:993 length:522 start_codon:yes stop_codon:yes gene_type:complete